MAIRCKVGQRGQVAVGDTDVVKLLEPEDARQSLMVQVLPGGEGLWVLLAKQDQTAPPSASDVRAGGLWLDPSADATHAGGSRSLSQAHAGAVYAVRASGGASSAVYYEEIVRG
jgi:hypothetical protein